MKVRQQELIALVSFKEFIWNETSGSVGVEGENKTDGMCLDSSAV